MVTGPAWQDQLSLHEGTAAGRSVHGKPAACCGYLIQDPGGPGFPGRYVTRPDLPADLLAEDDGELFLCQAEPAPGGSHEGGTVFGLGSRTRWGEPAAQVDDGGVH